MTKALAKKIVNLILLDISERKGIGDEWWQIDDETQQEIKDSWVNIIREVTWEPERQVAEV